jgi:hypothetical protein
LGQPQGKNTLQKAFWLDLDRAELLRQGLMSTRSTLAGAPSATSPKDIILTLGFDNGQEYNLFHIQHYKPVIGHVMHFLTTVLELLNPYAHRNIF